MPLVLYVEPLSPPSRAVMMTVEAIGLNNIEYRVIHLEKLDHLKPEFLKINPQHTIPTLVDENTILWDSHAIITYLVCKYGRVDSIYPKDLKKRAVIDQRLHFDTGSLFIYLRLFVKKCYGGRGRNVEEYERNFITDSYKLLEEFLTNSSFVAGDVLTIADLSIITSVTALNLLVRIDKENYPKLFNWVQKLESLEYYRKINEDGIKDLANFIAGISDVKL